MHLLLEQAKDQEHKAQMALMSAKSDLDGYYQQLHQIENYRLEYCRQLSNRGQQGLTASAFGHLNKFIVQLDETLAKQRDAEKQFLDNVQACEAHWQTCRQKKRSIEWLLEKREKERIQRENYQEQRLMDEFASLSHRRNH